MYHILLYELKKKEEIKNLRSLKTAPLHDVAVPDAGLLVAGLLVGTLHDDTLAAPVALYDGAIALGLSVVAALVLLVRGLHPGLNVVGRVCVILAVHVLTGHVRGGQTGRGSVSAAAHSSLGRAEPLHFLREAAILKQRVPRLALWTFNLMEGECVICLIRPESSSICRRAVLIYSANDCRVKPQSWESWVVSLSF